MYTKAQIDTTATTMGIDPAALTADQRIQIAGLLFTSYQSSLFANEVTLVSSMLAVSKAMEASIASLDAKQGV